jgi:hypothetical protein
LSVIQAGPFFALQRFQYHKDDLRRMYRSSKSFRSICHDYEKCSAALDYWLVSEHEEAPNRQREYSELINELELEILQSVEEGG